MGSPTVWKKGARHKIAAEDAYAEVRRIQDRFGVASPEVIVAEASDANSVLHPEFEWSDAKAAHEFRKEQARGLVQDLVYVDEERQERGPCFVSVTVSDGEAEKRGYMNTPQAFSAAITRDQVIREALLGLKAWKARYGHLRELASVTRAIDRTAQEVAA